MTVTYFVAEDMAGARYVAVVYRDGNMLGDGELAMDDPDVPASLRHSDVGESETVEE